MSFFNTYIRRVLGRFVSSCLLALLPDICSAQLSYSEVRKNVTVPSDDTTIDWVCEVTNIGQNKITILDIHTDCGCTTGKLSADSFGPGEKGKINIRMYISKEFPGVEAKHQIFVKTDDGRIQELNFNATIERAFNIAPRILLWRKGEVSSKVVRLTLNRKITQAQPTGVSGDAKGLFSETIKPGDADGEYILTIEPRVAVEEAKLVIIPVFDSPLIGLTDERAGVHLIVR